MVKQTERLVSEPCNKMVACSSDITYTVLQYKSQAQLAKDTCTWMSCAVSQVTAYNMAGILVSMQVMPAMWTNCKHSLLVYYFTGILNCNFM